MDRPMEISSTAIVSPRARLADNVVIGPFCIIEDEVEIGAGTRLDSHVIIKQYTKLGEGNHCYPGVVLGNDPEDKNFNGARSYLKIGHRNIFREYSSASRGTPPESATVIGDANYIMIGVHIAHNCRLGNDTVVCNNCSLAGYVELEDGAFLSGGVVVHQFSKIGHLAMIGGNTRVNLDVPPYLLASDFNVAARGLNVLGLKRAGFRPATIRQLKKAYQILYRSKLGLQEALERIEREIPIPEARHLVEFIRRSARGICRDFRSKSGRAGVSAFEEQSAIQE
ncbi:MAG: acyl-ACP--UDP-N-acetylglucosamine O-acyltransferase [Acidobacteria bacterium]|nr:acyl-ACP--UDP-N-acetylglucosamine O-acyltransferase [Acidobacteriota bacterium]